MGALLFRHAVAGTFTVTVPCSCLWPRLCTCLQVTIKGRTGARANGHGREKCIEIAKSMCAVQCGSPDNTVSIWLCSEALVLRLWWLYGHLVDLRPRMSKCCNGKGKTGSTSLCGEFCNEMLEWGNTIATASSTIACKVVFFCVQIAHTKNCAM